jgi:NADPH:quinone reductase-like Zn-dependent oxidoreductase
VPSRDNGHMKAIAQSRYGSPERVLELSDIDQPVPGDDEVLVRVRAASVHPDVWHVVSGLPYVLRVMGAGFFKPSNPVPGTDVAGTVEAVGRNVRGFVPGDEVFGEIVKGHQWHNGGAYAEYAVAPAANVARKPPNITFEQAAASPTSALIAIANLPARIEAGDQVLVNGAGGGVGQFALQIAKARGAEVTAVDGASKQDMMRAIGADHVIDYTQEDFTQGEEQYDAIVDIPGNHSFDDLKRVLASDGTYTYIGHDRYGVGSNRLIGSTLVRFLKLLVRSPFGGSRQVSTGSEDARDPIEILRELLESGQISPVIDRSFPLDEVPEALRYLAEGDPVGKVVVTI